MIWVSFVLCYRYLKLSQFRGELDALVTMIRVNDDMCTRKWGESSDHFASIESGDSRWRHYLFL